MSDLNARMKRLLGRGRSVPPQEKTSPTPAPEPEPAQDSTAGAASPGPWADWHAVEARLDELTGQSPDVVEAFVHEVINATGSAVVVACLARHPSSVNALRSWLEASLSQHGHAALRERATAGELVAAAFAAAARLLLPPATADATVGIIEDHVTPLSTQYFQFRDSVLGHRPAGTATAGAVSKHRLIIAEQFDDPQMVALLLPGCERATLLSTGDTYGRADFADRTQWTGSGDITVEHIRSRITRYSAEYIGLHEATARVAEQLASDLEAIRGLLRSEDRPCVAVAIADFLFFRALRFRAIEVILEDPSIDHVVIAISAQTPFSEFLRILPGIERIRTDPRVEFVSISREEQPRAGFWRALDTILAPPTIPPVPTRLPAEAVLRHFDSLARDRDLQVDVPDGPWVLLATVHNSAYDDSTVQFAADLGQDRPVRILHLKGSSTKVAKALQQVDESGSIPITTYDGGPVRDNPMTDLLRAHLQPRRIAVREQASAPHEIAAASGLHASIEALVGAIVVPALLRAKVLDHRFDSWQQASCLPATVVMVPQRHPAVGAIAAVARRYGVPSVAAEPHVYVPEYSRYNKIGADYYGVLSDYFLDGAVHEFGMVSRDRVRVIGSPRLTAPSGYDPVHAREQARAEYAEQVGFDFATAPVHLVFFCQPSGWEHVAPLWELLLDGVATSGAHLFFKPHPEEAPARIRLYEDAVARHGLSDRVTRLGGTAAEAVDLADVVATAYSAAALDAAIRQRPVVCVAVGDTQYPVNTAAISGAETCRSADELATYLTDYARDPSSAEARARAWIEREQQFIVGPGPALRALVDEAIERGPAGLRDSAELPRSLFTDGPHPVLQV